MKKHTETKQREFSQKTRKLIYDRDGGRCIFCQMGAFPGGNSFELKTLSIMHYVSKAHNGLGIEQNGALGCQWHHHMLDNGVEGNREEMLEMYADYMRNQYLNWDEEKLTYSKWDFLEV